MKHAIVSISNELAQRMIALKSKVVPVVVTSIILLGGLSFLAIHSSQPRNGSYEMANSSPSVPNTQASKPTLDTAFHRLGSSHYLTDGTTVLFETVVPGASPTYTTLEINPARFHPVIKDPTGMYGTDNVSVYF